MTGRELRLCRRCSHLYEEHYHRAVTLDDNCSCCDCPDFVDEPDFRPATTGAKP